jgi:membrane fusion protein (multidrug efflux system)
MKTFFDTDLFSRSWMAARGLISLIFLGGMAQVAAAQGGAQTQSQPAPVGVIALAAQDVPFALTVPGRAVAYRESDIRPQVTGVIDEISYSPGEEVSAGELMFRIESETFAADKRAAEAAVARAEAALATARNTLQRYEQLSGRSVSQTQVDDAEVAVLSAEADLEQARASLELAQLDLNRTEIRSPFTGQPSVATISIGAVVTGNQAEALATVTQLDPIYVDLVESSARVLRVEELIRSGALRVNGEIDFSLTLETGATYAQPGKLVSDSARVSETTGTLAYRVEFPNPDHVILPGQFLRADVTLGEREAFLVPQRAARRTAEGMLTFYVVRDGTAELVETSDLGSYENAWVVAEGPKEGDQLIVDGLTGLRSGAPVAPQEVRLDAAGRVVAKED